MKRKLALEVLAFLFILLFCYAAFNKILDFKKFSVQIGQSPLLTGFGDIIPIQVIVSEIVVSIMLMIPRFRLTGFIASYCLMVMFTAYIFAILNFSSYIPCSCGGVLEKLGWTEHLIFNAFFVTLAVVGCVLQAKVDFESNVNRVVA